jgi:hypothetical protein
MAAWDSFSVVSYPGHANPVADPTLPGGGDALQVLYDAGSSGFSCPDCGTAVGGLQFAGFASSLNNAPALYMQYQVKFPAGFDWGLIGKLPGLMGGTSTSCATASTSCTGAWSTRMEWHSATGTVHCTGTTCGGDLYRNTSCSSASEVGRGSFSFTADGKWHSIEQYVNTAGLGTITIWYDGKQVIQTTIGCAASEPVGGILFQTFYGGDAKSYGPSVPTSIDFGGAKTSLSKI